MIKRYQKVRDQCQFTGKYWVPPFNLGFNVPNEIFVVFSQRFKL